MKILLVETIVKTINWVKVLFTYFNHIFAELEAKDTLAIVKITFHLTFNKRRHSLSSLLTTVSMYLQIDFLA